MVVLFFGLTFLLLFIPLALASGVISQHLLYKKINKQLSNKKLKLLSIEQTNKSFKNSINKPNVSWKDFVIMDYLPASYETYVRVRFETEDKSQQTSSVKITSFLYFFHSLEFEDLSGQ